ncbi:MAG: IS1595 family transposase [Acidobacteriaceae bacterium]|nr:IS1595 family transposase [Acidobacteriaceae bacterium]
MAGLIARHHQDERAARAYLESALWPDGPVCPKCGVIDEAYRLRGETTRDGLYKCAGCRAPFTVTMGTIFEDSHIPLHKWLFAIYLMCSSKKGMSAHQLWRNLWGVDEETGKQKGSYKTAWFMAHRIRWALGQQPVASKLAGIVEVDECYIGGKHHTGKYGYEWSASGRPKPGPRKGRSPVENKAAVVSILQRDGEVRSKHVGRVTGENLRPMIETAVDTSAHVITDTSTALTAVPKEHKHSQVNHRAKEYVRHEDGVVITTNTVEGYFGIIKRGIDGIYHHVGKQYLDQYLREFDFRYNVRKLNDRDRSVLAIKKTSGKRLTLKQPKDAEREPPLPF